MGASEVEWGAATQDAHVVDGCGTPSISVIVAPYKHHRVGTGFNVGFFVGTLPNFITAEAVAAIQGNPARGETSGV